MKSLSGSNQFKYTNVNCRETPSNAASKRSHESDDDFEYTPGCPKRKQSVSEYGAISNCDVNNDFVAFKAPVAVDKTYASTVGNDVNPNNWVKAGSSKQKKDSRNTVISSGTSAKKSVKGIIGSGAVQGSLARVPKRFHFKVGRFQASVEESDIKKHVEGFVKSGVVEVTLMNMMSFNYYKRFKVSVDDTWSSEMWNEKNWPEGIEVSRFFIRNSNLANTSDAGKNKSAVPSGVNSTQGLLTSGVSAIDNYSKNNNDLEQNNMELTVNGENNPTNNS